MSSYQSLPPRGTALPQREFLTRLNVSYQVTLTIHFNCVDLNNQLSLFYFTLLWGFILFCFAVFLFLVWYVFSHDIYFGDTG